MFGLERIFQKYRHLEDVLIVHYFSYWIYIWFIVYYILLWIPSQAFWIEVIKKRANPRFALILALMFEICDLGLHLLNGTPFLSLLKFILLNVLIKIIPLYLLRNQPLFVSNDLLVFSSLLFVYFYYMFFLIDKDPRRIYMDSFQDISNGGNRTPFFQLFQALFGI